MVAISERTHVYGFWFVPGDNMDWQGSLTKQDGEPWEFNYRLRYYKDDKAFGSNDEKRCHTMRANPDLPDDEARDKLVQQLPQLLRMIESQFGHPHQELIVDCRGDDPKLIFELGACPFMHIKVGEEAKKYAQDNGMDGGIIGPADA